MACPREPLLLKGPPDKVLSEPFSKFIAFPLNSSKLDAIWFSAVPSLENCRYGNPLSPSKNPLKLFTPAVSGPSEFAATLKVE